MSSKIEADLTNSISSISNKSGITSPFSNVRPITSKTQHAATQNLISNPIDPKDNNMISNPNLNGNEIQTTAAQFEVFYSNKTTQKPPTSKSPNYELTS